MCVCSNSCDTHFISKMTVGICVKIVVCAIKIYSEYQTNVRVCVTNAEHRKRAFSNKTMHVERAMTFVRWINLGRCSNQRLFSIEIALARLPNGTNAHEIQFITPAFEMLSTFFHRLCVIHIVFGSVHSLSLWSILTQKFPNKVNINSLYWFDSLSLSLNLLLLMPAT